MEPKPHIYIVGSGTAGTFLSFRLLSKGFHVTLVDEQIDWQRKSTTDATWQQYFGLVALNDLWTIEAYPSEIVEIFRTTSQSSLKGRTIGYPCRKGIGGNSNINAMMHDIGHVSVFNSYWPKSWNAELILKYEKMVDELLTPYKHKLSGNMNLILEDALEIAKKENAARSVVKNGSFTIAASGLQRLRLIKVLEKLPQTAYERLMLVKGSVSRLVIQGSSVTGLLLANGDHMPISGRSKVVLCCGAVKTPTILYNSLPKPAFTHKQEDSVRNSIGKVALDHFTLPYVCFGNWHKAWKSSLTRPLNGVHGWIFLDADGNLHKDDAKIPPRTQLIFVDGSILVGLVDIIVPRWEKQSTVWSLIRIVLVGTLRLILSLSFVRWISSGIFGVLVCLVQPETRGKCSFTSTVTMDTNGHGSEEKSATDDVPVPADYNINIDPQLFSDKGDQQALHAAYMRARLFLQESSKLGHISYLELLPGPLLNYANSLSTFVEFASWFGTTYFHISGTCPMDRYKDDKIETVGVLADNLQVKGIKNLFAADASIFPAIPSFPTAKLSMIIGTRAADIICEETYKDLAATSKSKSKSKMQL